MSSKDEAVFNPRSMTVAGVEEELAGMPDLTVDELKALLKAEGKSARPRHGVEKAIDGRLAALAEAALEAVAEDMHEATEVRIVPGPVGPGTPFPAEAVEAEEAPYGTEIPVLSHHYDFPLHPALDTPLTGIHEALGIDVAEEEGEAVEEVAHEAEPEPEPVEVPEP
ncbi:MAG: hypothetical protein NUW01_14085, partial [Gemmatimonadaceae bacterium]|nr:hypothetical protein [Gemmatimonadaceae bacterium]